MSSIDEHPTKAVLDAFLRAELDTSRRNQVVRHLLRCGSCARTLGPMWLMPLPVDLSAYDWPVARAARRVLDSIEAAPVQLSAILAARTPPGFDRTTLAGLSGLHLSAGLLRASRNSLATSPAEALTLAALAVAVADSALSAGLLSPHLLYDALARARTELANARRVTEDHVQALQDLELAARDLDHGSGSPLDRARLLDVAASLFRALRRLDDAESSLSQAHRLYTNLGDFHLAGRILISWGILRGVRLDYPAALRLLERGLALVDRHRDPRLAFVALHNIVSFLVEDDRTDDARLLLDLPHTRSLYQAHAGPYDLLQRRWVEARIDLAAADFARAKESLLAVREGFSRAARPFLVALVGLDLARLYLDSGELDRIPPLAAEMLLSFRAFEAPQEALAALLLLEQAASSRSLTIAILRDVANTLRRHEA